MQCVYDCVYEFDWVSVYKQMKESFEYSLKRVVLNSFRSVHKSRIILYVCVCVLTDKPEEETKKPTNK